MKFFLLVFIICFPLVSQSVVYNTRVEGFDKGIKTGEPDLLFFSDGRVGVIPRSLSQAVQTRRLILRGSFVKVKLDKHHNVLSLEASNNGPKTDLQVEVAPLEVSSYEPTILPDLESVTTIFKRMNRSWQNKSQCYNRAHVWNYEEFELTGLLSKKVFIFYTRRYIRNYRFYWWFHAIPTVLARSQGSIVERALDPMFAKSALPMKTWTDIFIRSKSECPVITKYSSYINNQETEDCYLHYSSMYFWQPRDLDKLERTGFEKTSFIKSEVDYAYREAF